jgi:hypothetical protein
MIKVTSAVTGKQFEIDENEIVSMREKTFSGVSKAGLSVSPVTTLKMKSGPDVEATEAEIFALIETARQQAKTPSDGSPVS